MLSVFRSSLKNKVENPTILEARNRKGNLDNLHLQQVFARERF